MRQYFFQTDIGEVSIVSYSQLKARSLIKARYKPQFIMFKRSVASQRPLGK